MIAIRIDWISRTFVLMADDAPLLAYRKYKHARKRFDELTTEPTE